MYSLALGFRGVKSAWPQDCIRVPGAKFAFAPRPDSREAIPGSSLGEPLGPSRRPASLDSKSDAKLILLST
jgi:hypothetical protein